MTPVVTARVDSISGETPIRQEFRGLLRSNQKFSMEDYPSPKRRAVELAFAGVLSDTLN
jgi:hypothetical protein